MKPIAWAVSRFRDWVGRMAESRRRGYHRTLEAVLSVGDEEDAFVSADVIATDGMMVDSKWRKRGREGDGVIPVDLEEEEGANLFVDNVPKPKKSSTFADFDDDIEDEDEDELDWKVTVGKKKQRNKSSQETRQKNVDPSEDWDVRNYGNVGPEDSGLEVEELIEKSLEKDTEEIVSALALDPTLMRAQASMNHADFAIKGNEQVMQVSDDSNEPDEIGANRVEARDIGANFSSPSRGLVPTHLYGFKETASSSFNHPSVYGDPLMQRIRNCLPDKHPDYIVKVHCPRLAFYAKLLVEEDLRRPSFMESDAAVVFKRMFDFRAPFEVQRNLKTVSIMSLVTTPLSGDDELRIKTLRTKKPTQFMEVLEDAVADDSKYCEIEERHFLFSMCSPGTRRRSRMLMPKDTTIDEALEFFKECNHITDNLIVLGRSGVGFEEPFTTLVAQLDVEGMNNFSLETLMIQNAPDFIRIPAAPVFVKTVVPGHYSPREALRNFDIPVRHRLLMEAKLYLEALRKSCRGDVEQATTLEEDIATALSQYTLHPSSSQVPIFHGNTIPQHDNETMRPMRPEGTSLHAVQAEQFIDLDDELTIVEPGSSLMGIAGVLSPAGPVSQAVDYRPQPTGEAGLLKQNASGTGEEMIQLRIRFGETSKRYRMRKADNLDKILTKFCEYVEKPIASAKIIFDGDVVTAKTTTPNMLDMEDDDLLDVTFQ